MTRRSYVRGRKIRNSLAREWSRDERDDDGNKSKTCTALSVRALLSIEDVARANSRRRVDEPSFETHFEFTYQF